jgi:hypothetical protein
MSLTLGRQGGIAQPLKKRTVGQTNIAHVYDGANHIWPTSVIHFSDFTSVQLRYIWGSDDGRDLDTKSYYVNSPINSLNYKVIGLDDIKIIRHGGGLVHGDGYCWYENKPNDKYKVWNNQVNTTGTPLTLDKPCPSGILIVPSAKGKINIPLLSISISLFFNCQA